MATVVTRTARKPMNRSLKIFLIVVGVVFTLWVIGRMTNTLQYHKTASSANYPTLDDGDLFFTSNLVSPGRGDLVSYTAEDEYFGKHVRVHPICGMPGDRVEMRAGVLYVNGKNADEGKRLAHTYLLHQAQLIKLRSAVEIKDEDVQWLTQDSIYVTLADDILIKHVPEGRKYVMPREQITPEILALFKENWNPDHFGPVVVPEGHYFLVGDNRHASQDSRYTGFVHKDRVVGTVLGK